MIFKPRILVSELEYYIHDTLREMEIENDKIYNLTEELVDMAYPSFEDEYDKRWTFFYLPVKEDIDMPKRKLIAIPVSIMEYKKEFYLSFQSYGRFVIKKGDKEYDRFYKRLIYNIIRFVPTIKKDGNMLEKLIPYYIRKGKIKGKFVLDEILSQEEKEKILENYEKRNKEPIKDISLNDYLFVCSICYKGAYAEELEKKNLTPKEMYKKWADGRDGGMLSIRDWDSKEEFAKWLHSGLWAGSHPYEIVFSWHEHGIHLYPPREDSEDHYALRVTNYAYARDFIKMVDILIKENISFEAREIENVLDYLSGDTYFSVNNRAEEHNISYGHTKEEKKVYFPHIEWEEIKIVKWKK